MIENINWYTGHMKKTRELIAENLKMVDLVIEVIDSRIPRSSRNPIIDELIQNKKRIIILNKSDLSDDKANNVWADYFRSQGNLVMKMNANRGDGVKELFRMLEKLQDEKNRDKALKKPLRMMIVGVPNVGKSSLINRMTGRKSAKTGDKPKAVIVSAADHAKQKAEERAKKIQDFFKAKHPEATTKPDGTPVKRGRGRPRKNPIV